MKILSSVILAASLATSAFGSIVYVGGSGGDTPASFTGSFDYTAAANGLTATLVVSLTNTSPVDNGGYLTGFAFNNPGFTGATLSSYSAGTGTWGILGDPDFDNEFTASPFGIFDIGAVLNGGSDWEGGGSPTGGVAVGNTGTWTFALTGTGLNAFSASSFLGVYAQEIENNKGTKTYVDADPEISLAVRFRGFDDGGSAKVPGTEVPPPPRVIPEPSHYALMMGGATAFLAVMRRRRNAAKS